MDHTQSTWSIGSMKPQRHLRVMAFSSSGHFVWFGYAGRSLNNLHYSAAGADILLLSPPRSKVSLVQYRMIGGVLDFYFFSGPSPQNVIEQYGAMIGLPTFQPLWGFGFHLCR